MSSGSDLAGARARRLGVLVAAGLGPVLDVDAVQLERDPVFAGAGRVAAR
jgi:hypothetical protein